MQTLKKVSNRNVELTDDTKLTVTHSWKDKTNPELSTTYVMTEDGLTVTTSWKGTTCRKVYTLSSLVGCVVIDGRLQAYDCAQACEQQEINRMPVLQGPLAKWLFDNLCNMSLSGAESFVKTCVVHAAGRLTVYTFEFADKSACQVHVDVTYETDASSYVSWRVTTGHINFGTASNENSEMIHVLDTHTYAPCRTVEEGE